jgi:hypothetical protein
MTAYALRLTESAILQRVREEAKGHVPEKDMPALEQYCLEKIPDALLQLDFPEEVEFFVNEFLAEKVEEESRLEMDGETRREFMSEFAPDFV